MTREYLVDLEGQGEQAKRLREYAGYQADFLAPWIQQLAIAERLEAIVEELEHIGKILDARMK